MAAMFKPICSLFAFMLLCSCEKKLSFPVAHTYVVRGQVEQLPEKNKPYSSFMVAHEAIPDFHDVDGEKVGMVAMVMDFPCSDLGMLAPLQVGDKIQMTVVVSKEITQWDILSIEKLAPETALQITR